MLHLSKSDLIHNAYTLSLYEELEASHKEPKLGVLHHRQLVIISSKASKLHEFFIQFFKTCISFVYEKLGYLNRDPKMIKQLKEGVNEFFLYGNAEFSNLKDVIQTDQSDNSQLDNPETVQEKQTSQIDVNADQLLEITRQIEQKQAEIDALNEEYDALSAVINDLKQTHAACVQKNQKALIKQDELLTSISQKVKNNTALLHKYDLEVTRLTLQKNALKKRVKELNASLMQCDSLDTAFADGFVKGKKEGYLEGKASGSQKSSAQSRHLGVAAGRKDEKKRIREKIQEHVNQVFTSFYGQQSEIIKHALIEKLKTI